MNFFLKNLKVKVSLNDLLSMFVESIDSFLPKADKVFLYSPNRTEGNVIEVFLFLSRNTHKKVVLISPPSKEYLRKLGWVETNNIVFVENLFSLKSFYHYMTSQWIFFTHGAFGQPFRKRSVVVNLWHGEGPKGGDYFPKSKGKARASTFVLSSAAALSFSAFSRRALAALISSLKRSR